jgi:hypothetical protein
VSKPISLFIITALVTIPSIKEFRVINVFLVARLTIHYTESVIYIISLDVIGEPITITAELNSV